MPSAQPQVHSPADESIDDSVLANQSISASHMYRDRVAKTPNGVAYQYAVVGADGDTWTSVTWAQAKDHTDKLSAGLIALGVQPEERVAIASATRLEWVYADLAIMTAGRRHDHDLSVDDRRGTLPSSSVTPTARSSSPRTPRRSTNCGRSAAKSRTSPRSSSSTPTVSSSTTG